MKSRLRDAVGWCVALVVLAWFTTTHAAQVVDYGLAEKVELWRAQASPQWTDLLTDLSRYVRPWTLLPASLVIALLFWPVMRRAAFVVPMSFVNSILVTYAIKWLVGRPRPESVMSTHDAAFPSAHVAGTASIGMAVIQVLLPLLRRTARKLLRVAVVVLVGVVALSRIWVGAHWLSDIIGGLFAAVIGLLLALALLNSRIFRRRIRRMR